MSYNALENVNAVKLGFWDRLRLDVRLLLCKAAYQLCSLAWERQETIEATANLPILDGGTSNGSYNPPLPTVNVLGHLSPNRAILWCLFP